MKTQKILTINLLLRSVGENITQIAEFRQDFSTPHCRLLKILYVGNFGTKSLRKRFARHQD